ncbi:hypothetical protein KFL_000140620 [Klebsormidium nitens]|uniref:BTB domain-containing protein n=1 Tax=Klebsormidium nitens TaxID=105231 RepID=A0A1Y1HNH8_KLENI|nr:hypothetical protein KFL_000140620 [Klebsormidium nitens]|eukprot:GAQ78541.1 hypothetical protein KFL_000140620 [Klebsormidium nitens]
MLKTLTAMTSAPVATLTDTRTAIIKTFESLKRDSSGNRIPSWKEECRSTFNLQFKSEAVGCNDKSLSLLLSCASFHQELPIPLTLKCSDTNQITYIQHIQRTIPEVQLNLSLAKPNMLGYKASISSCSVAPGALIPPRAEPQALPNPPVHAGVAPLNFGFAAPPPPPAPLFGGFGAAAAHQPQPTATQCTPGENGSWKVVLAPGRSISLCLEILLESPKRGDSAPVQFVAGMLQDAHETGDVEIQSKEGTFAYAHTAVLVKVPYFSKQFSETWAKEKWNLHNKLRCQMPCQATNKAITSFLQYVYGNKHAVFEQDAGTLQELFSLGEACQVNELCRDVADVTSIDSDSLLGWIRWLKGEHVSAVDVIADKATAYVRRLVETKNWANVSADLLETVVLGLQLVPIASSSH